MVQRVVTVNDVLDGLGRVVGLVDGELQELGEVERLLQDANRVQVQGSGLKLSDDLRRELEAVFQRYGGSLETLGHPTTKLEDLFLHIVKESKAHPGRRYRPGEGGGPYPAEEEAGNGSTDIREGNPARS